MLWNPCNNIRNSNLKIIGELLKERKKDTSFKMPDMKTDNYYTCIHLNLLYSNCNLPSGFPRQLCNRMPVKKVCPLGKLAFNGKHFMCMIYKINST